VTARPTADATRSGFSYVALGAMWFGRFLGNWSLRFTYAFLPSIARGVGVSLDTAGLVAGGRELAGVTGPLLSRLVDRGARRTALSVALLSLAMASTTAVVGGLAGFALGMIVAGLAKVAYDVAANAWIGDHVPYARRGKVTGVFETSWAAAFLIGVPITAVLMDEIGWRAPFLVIAALAAFVALVTPGVVAPDRPIPVPPGSRHHLRPAALAFYGALFLQSLGPQLVFASYGAWFEHDFGLDVEAVGAATVLFGAAELVASGASAAFTDRVGKRRSMIGGLVLVAPMLVLMGTTGAGQAVSVALLAVTFLGFEYSLISGIPLAAEIDPEARSRTIGISYASMTAARAVGAAGGVWLFNHHGIGWTGGLGAAITALAIAVIALRVEEPGHHPAAAGASAR
jgi:predicted MFS family arabinose efflux permease